MELFAPGSGSLAEEEILPAPARGRPGAAEIGAAVRTLIAAAGDDPDREGLADTPARVARQWRERFSGYWVDPDALLEHGVGEAADYDEILLLAGIPFVSTCERHMTAIAGRAHLAYRPRRHVAGISALVRLVDTHARRLQLQERLTTGIARTIDRVLRPRGVAVIVEARHDGLAASDRSGIAMVTKCWLGDFRSDSRLRRELMESLALKAGSER
jgi:GTP cyclohydrolase IA